MVRKAKRRGLDLGNLPYAEEAQTATDFIEFFTETLPAFILRHSDNFDRAWAEADLFNTLSALPDRELKKRGIARVDIPLIVLSAFHLVHVARKRKRRGPAGTRKRRTARKTAKKKV